MPLIMRHRLILRHRPEAVGVADAMSKTKLTMLQRPVRMRLSGSSVASRCKALLVQQRTVVHRTFQSMSSPPQPPKLPVCPSLCSTRIALRVLRCNPCSSIIVSPHHPENVQLITEESQYFFSDEQKRQSTAIWHFSLNVFRGLIIYVLFSFHHDSFVVFSSLCPTKP
jgi:hypothetical protein